MSYACLSRLGGFLQNTIFHPMASLETSILRVGGHIYQPASLDWTTPKRLPPTLTGCWHIDITTTLIGTPGRDTVGLTQAGIGFLCVLWNRRAHDLQRAT